MARDKAGRITIVFSKDEVVIIICTVLTCRNFWQWLVDHYVLEMKYMADY